MSSDVRPAAELGPAETALASVLQRGVSKLVSPAGSHASRLAALKRIATVLVAAPRPVWRRTQDVPGCNVTCALVGHLRLIHAQASAATGTLLAVRTNAGTPTPELPPRAVNALSEALHEAELCLLLLPGLLLSHKYSSDFLALPGVVDLLLVLLGLFAGLRHPQALPELELPRLPQDPKAVLPPKSSLQALSTSLVVLSLQVLGPALKGRADTFSARGGEELLDQIRQHAPSSGQAPNKGDALIFAALEEFLSLVQHPEEGWETTMSTPQTPPRAPSLDRGSRPFPAASTSSSRAGSTISPSTNGKAGFVRTPLTASPRSEPVHEHTSMSVFASRYEGERLEPSSRPRLEGTKKAEAPGKRQEGEEAPVTTRLSVAGGSRPLSTLRASPLARPSSTALWMEGGSETAPRRRSLASFPDPQRTRSNGLSETPSRGARPVATRSQTALPPSVERAVLPSSAIRASSSSPHVHRSSSRLGPGNPRTPVHFTHSPSPLPVRGARAPPSSSSADTAVH